MSVYSQWFNRGRLMELIDVLRHASALLFLMSSICWAYATYCKVNLKEGDEITVLLETIKLQNTWNRRAALATGLAILPQVMSQYVH